MQSYGKGRNRFVACNSACASGFRTDRRHGIIYGPYMLTDQDGTAVRLARDAEEASRWSGECIYCNAIDE